MSGLPKREFDAVVVGAGPNGLAAAIRLQQQGLSVLVLEGKDTIGGGTRTAELTLPGFIHDICSAIHPLAEASPFFKTLPLHAHGLEYIQTPIAAAHPFDGGNAAALHHSPEYTAIMLGRDKQAYLQLMQPLVESWPSISRDVLGPLHMPDDPMAFAKFGMNALPSAQHLSKRFQTKEAKGFWAGMAAHAIQPLSNTATSAIALVLLITGHSSGWPFPKGGSHRISQALASYFTSIGGKIETNFYVRSMDQLPSSHAVLFDVTPRQLLQIAGQKFSSFYQWQLRRYRHGMGVFKIDWALDGPVPFQSDVCRQAGTVHLGDRYEEIAACERMVWKGKHPEKPFVLFAQQSLFDPCRAPSGKQVAWAYCHVPYGSTVDMSSRIERQVERFAPGFRDLILAKHTFNTKELEAYNPNYIGGDINGGVNDIRQLFTRPALRASPYRTSSKGIYICSSSTPPGGGVHGMCGLHAANRALRDVFGLRIENKL
ncbi:MAG: NAD(P)/FAD-dependent oxidoreductase [Chryseosolibacter sp.]